MHNRGLSRTTTRACCPLVAVLTLIVLLAFMAPPAAAHEGGTVPGPQYAVSVEVSIAPCVRVGADGHVRSNIPAVTVQHAELLTVLPR